MKTFTETEFGHAPRTVLDAADLDRIVEIRRTDGRSYLLRASDESQPPRPSNLPDFAARRRAAGMQPIPEEISRQVEEWISDGYLNPLREYGTRLARGCAPIHSGLASVIL